jgi:hypothetical protein
MPPDDSNGLHPGERLRLDYDHTTDLLRTLTDVRFKLLALVPTISGTAIGLLGRQRTAADLLGVGLLGLLATLGILLYELRNTQVYNYGVRRAEELERQLGLVAAFGAEETGGLFTERPDRTLRLFGVTVGHDHGLTLVYSAALAGWSYVVAWGALRELDVGSPRKVGAVIGVGLGLVVLATLRPSAGSSVNRRERRTDRASGASSLPE